jgi:hypothetical protein
VRSLPGETPRAPRTPASGGQGRTVVDGEGNVRYGAGVESAGGRLAPGRRGIDAEDVRLWRQRESPRTPREIDETNELISGMDEAVATARQRGVPDDVIDGVLAEARRMDPETGSPVYRLESAEGFVSSRLEWEIATRNQERILVSAGEREQLAFNSTLPNASATPEHLARVEVVDVVRLESVITKSRLEAEGKPQIWTPEEIRYGRTIERRLEAGEDLASAKTLSDLGEDVYGPGLRPVFGPDDLSAIRTTFDGRPLRIAPETPVQARAPGGARKPAPDTSEAPTVDPAAPTERIDPSEAPSVDPSELPTQPPTERLDPAERAAALEDATATQRLDPTERLVDPDAPTERIDPTERLDSSETPTVPTVPQDLPTQRIDRQPAEFIVDDPAGFLRSLYGNDAAAARAYEIAIRELGPENVYGIAGSYAKGNPRVRSWPEDIGYLDARALDKLGTDLPPSIVERLPSRIQELVTRKREMGGGQGLPSDLDVVVSTSVESKTLEAVGAKIFEETGVLVEFPGGARPSPSRPSAAAETATQAVVDPALDAGAVGGPSGRAATTPQPDPVSPGGGWREEPEPASNGSSPIEIVILSKGGSTGPVLEMLALNYGPPVVIRTGRLILEPFEPDAETRIRIEQIRAGARTGAWVPPGYSTGGGSGPLEATAGHVAASAVPLVLEGFCLQLERAVPTAGTVYRIAGREVQQSGTSIGTILDAGGLLKDLGGLHPDTDPDVYFHSIRQWAIWVHEEDLDREEFGREFVEQARRAFEEADHEWTSDVERRLKEFIPNRWSDVVAILEVAGRRVPETRQ